MRPPKRERPAHNAALGPDAPAPKRVTTFDVSPTAGALYRCLVTDAAQPVPPMSSGHVHPEAAVAPGYLANHAARLFNRRIDAALRPHGLTLALIGPILLLSWKGPMLQRDIVRSSAVKQPAMVALLDKLEAMALIVRTPSTTDRRAAMVRLTDRGFEAARIGGKSLTDANAEGLRGFATDEATELVDLLHRLIANFEET